LETTAYSNYRKVRNHARVCSNQKLMRHLHTQVLARLFASAWLLCANACTGDATNITEAAFELSLPGRWDGGYDEKSSTWVYLTPSNEEGITVSTLRRGPDPDGSKLQADLVALLKMRRNMEQQFSDEPITLTEPTTSRARGQLTAVFDTIGTTSQRRKRTLLMVNRVAAGSFCYEVFGLSEPEFAARASAVLGPASLVPETSKPSSAR
jgi:hypothetical protein